MFSVWLQASLCSNPDVFTGEVSCMGNPMVDVTLERGECALLPLCPERGFVAVREWDVLESPAVNLADADNAGVRNDPSYQRMVDGGPVFWKESLNGNLQVCVGDSATRREVIQGWLVIESTKKIDDKYLKKLISYRIRVAGDDPMPDAGVDDAGVGVDASTPDTGPARGIADAFLSPELPPGVETHFTGVTQFVMAKLTNRAAELRVSCSLSGGDDCDMTFDVSAPSGDSTMREVALPPSMAAEQYEFSLRAAQSGALSARRSLTATLSPSVGMLKCERATNGLFGTDELRWFGVQLETPGGSPVAMADYYRYERTTPGQGWGSPTGQLAGEPHLLLSGGNDYIHPDRNFLIIAVDSMSGTVVAAREFRWDEIEGGTTQSCRVCDMSATGDCRIILP